MALLRLLVLVAGAFSKQVTPQQTPTVGPLTTVSLKFESLQGGLGLTQWTWKRRRMTLETTTALVLSVVWWWRLGTAEITGRSAPFPLSSLKSLAHPLVLYFFSFVRSTKLATRFPTRHHTIKMASAGRGCHKTVFFHHPTPRFASHPGSSQPFVDQIGPGGVPPGPDVRPVRREVQASLPGGLSPRTGAPCPRPRASKIQRVFRA